MAEPEVRGEGVTYTCPMHPEIVRDAPGNCPICGMTLEPRTVSTEEGKNPELVDMTRRFKVSVSLSAPLIIIAMRHLIPGLSVLEDLASTPYSKWSSTGIIPGLGLFIISKRFGTGVVCHLLYSTSSILPKYTRIEAVIVLFIS